MDNQTMSIVALVVSIGGIVLGIVNHKRIRSNCCGKKGEASFDIDTTTPPKITPIASSGS
jgi:hypothetical protein